MGLHATIHLNKTYTKASIRKYLPGVFFLQWPETRRCFVVVTLKLSFRIRLYESPIILYGNKLGWEAPDYEIQRL
jgi:hypothetical protein